jgi:hypothetical protein
VPYEIARSALFRFVERQVTMIEATPLPADIRDIAGAHDLSDDELHGVWLGAGLATQVGLVLVDTPERFINPSPGVPRSPPPNGS